jgi:hypothetical protein
LTALTAKSRENRNITGLNIRATTSMPLHATFMSVDDKSTTPSNPYYSSLIRIYLPLKCA